jgi:hypothetical protein
MWGVAPGVEASAGELPSDQKVAHLVQFVRQRGSLDSIDGPATIDVRRELIVTPRTARNKAKTAAAEATQTK